MRQQIGTWEGQHYLTAPGAAEFVAAVPPIVFTANRTRLLIAIGRSGPRSSLDLYRSIGEAGHFRVITPLEGIGLLARVRHRHGFVCGLNVAHPAQKAFRAFAKALARKWVPPECPQSEGRIDPVPLPKQIPCTLFGREDSTRALYLVRTRGHVTPAELEQLGIFAAAGNARVALNRYVKNGLLASERIAVGAGRPRRYFMSADFIAYQELGALIDAMVLHVHPEIARSAAAL